MSMGLRDSPHPEVDPVCPVRLQMGMGGPKGPKGEKDGAGEADWV